MLVVKFNIYRDSIGEKIYLLLKKKEGVKKETLYNWSRSEHIRCFNESDVMKGKRIFKDIHILIGVFRSSFHLLLSVPVFFHWGIAQGA